MTKSMVKLRHYFIGLIGLWEKDWIYFVVAAESFESCAKYTQQYHCENRGSSSSFFCNQSAGWWC